MSQKYQRSASALVLYLFVLVAYFGNECLGQTFSSGSTGADGALNLTMPGTITFDPVALGLHPALENVYNFTTINIAAGVTVVLTSKKLSGPVYWLTQGAVTISGTLNLDGEVGLIPTFSSNRVPSAGGAGGFNGGVGGGGELVAQSGNGPGGGTAATTRIGGGGGPGSGKFTGSQYLIPLIGGSGGGGGLSPGYCAQSTQGAAGGGGGGAILIASSTTITIGGSNGSGIFARGLESQCDGGFGSGGAIRLVANTVTSNSTGGTPHLDVQRSNTNPGQIRIEAFDSNVNGSNTIISGPIITSPPYSLALPLTAPSALKVTSLVVGGVTISIDANPFTFPDATINSSTPVTVNVRAQFIPIGTVPKIIVMAETGVDQTVNCSALAGTLQQSTCSAQITFPTGGSRGFVKATWNP